MIIMDMHILVLIKYIACIFITGVILIAPLYLAAFNDKGDYDSVLVRAACILLVWTGIAWLWGLYKASK